MATIHPSNSTSPPRRTSEVIPEQARKLTMWSWIMLAVAVASTIVAAVLGYAFMALLDVAEGDVLTSAGLAGWAAMLVVLAVQATPLAIGTLLGGRATKAGGGGSAAAACIVNALLLAFVVFTAAVTMLAA